MKLEEVVIVSNGRKKESPVITSKIENFLRERKIKVSSFITEKDANEINISEEADLLISVGGDGTVLSSARLVQGLGIPILAVNLGTFGYITEIGSEEWEEALTLILKDKEKISRRLMLRVAVMRGGARIFQSFALNEVVVSSTGLSKVIRLDLEINSTKAGTFRSDGLIVATPTGSTGYSLAAGGPVMDSEMSAMIITPICPFTLSNRPLVLGSNEVITVKVDPDQRTGLMLSVDGQLDLDLEEGDEIVIEKSRSKALLIASNRRNYTDVIRTKLNWSGELHA